MSNNKVQYTRKQGKKLTYDIETSSNSYVISLNGKTLKLRGPFAGHFGDVGAADALIMHAKSDIEHLAGMSEE
jgi:hypothetical protein